MPVAATLPRCVLPRRRHRPIDTRDVVSKVTEPARITAAKGVPGPQPGETTFRWKTSGVHTDYYKITTALTPFGPRHGSGAPQHDIRGGQPGPALAHFEPVPDGSRWCRTNTGLRLFFRIKSVNKSGSSSNVRPYRHLRHATVNGQSSRMSGAQLRVAQFNVRVEASDIRGHRWKKRQHLVARTIARVHPTVMGVQELMPAMWTGRRSAGSGLNRSLKRVGAGYYRVTRSTGYFKGAAQDTRILYNPRRVRDDQHLPAGRALLLHLAPERGTSRGGSVRAVPRPQDRQAVLLRQRPSDGGQHRGQGRPPWATGPGDPCRHQQGEHLATCRSCWRWTPTARRPAREWTLRTRPSRVRVGTTPSPQRGRRTCVQLGAALPPSAAAVAVRVREHVRHDHDPRHARGRPVQAGAGTPPRTVGPQPGLHRGPASTLLMLRPATSKDRRRRRRCVLTSS